MSRSARFFGFISIGLIFFPFATLAANGSPAQAALSAGFATTPLWISSASPVDGDALKLFAVVNDTSTTTVGGTVSFSVDGITVGSAKVSLDAGTAQIVSTAWTAVAGTHSITATLDNSVDANGQPVSLSETIAGPLSITVATAPPKPVILQYLDTAMNAVSPALSGALAAIDSARQSGADYFATQLGLGATNTAQQSQVLGTSTKNLAKIGDAAITATTSSPSWFNRLAYLFFNNPIVFYPILLFSLLLALWLISRVFSRK